MFKHFKTYAVSEISCKIFLVETFYSNIVIYFIINIVIYFILLAHNIQKNLFI